MTYTEVSFSLKSGFKKIGLTQKFVLVLNRDSQKYCLHQFFLYQRKGFISRKFGLAKSVCLIKVQAICGWHQYTRFALFMKKKVIRHSY